MTLYTDLFGVLSVQTVTAGSVWQYRYPASKGVLPTTPVVTGITFTRDMHVWKNGADYFSVKIVRSTGAVSL